MAYRSSQDGLTERISVLEAEVAGLREAASAETQRNALRAERREALAVAQTRIAELERDAAALRAKRPMKASRHDVVKPTEPTILRRWFQMQRAFGLGIAAGASAYVLSDEPVVALVFAAVPVVGTSIYLSGWRGEGL